MRGCSGQRQARAARVRADHGDVVEVFTSKAEGAGPTRDWLQFVKSARARSKIRAWFSKERREEAVEKGKESLTRAMRKAGLPVAAARCPAARCRGSSPTCATPTSPRCTPRSARGASRAANVVQRLVAAHGGADGATEDLAEVITPTKATGKARPQGDPGVVVDGVDDVWVKLARCCTPVPGDPILGLRHARARRLGAPARLRQRRVAAARSRTAWSR